MIEGSEIDTKKCCTNYSIMNCNVDYLFYTFHIMFDDTASCFCSSTTSAFHNILDLKLLAI